MIFTPTKHTLSVLIIFIWVIEGLKVPKSFYKIDHVFPSPLLAYVKPHKFIIVCLFYVWTDLGTENSSQP